jgi:hypothetical protein
VFFARGGQLGSVIIPGELPWVQDYLAGWLMTLGRAPGQADLFRTTAAYCDGRVAPGSIYGILHRECFALFPDEMFADLFDDVGRRSVPPMIVAVVMVLQRIEGLSDREAVERFSFDARWKYACGGLDFDYPGFVHTVLVDMRARLARSARPDRIFAVTLGAARQAGLVGRRRVLDSTPLYDAVATMDTVTLVRSAIRGLLKACDGELAVQLRHALARDDDYVMAGKPVCDYDDPQAREELVDALAKDAWALLAALDGRELSPVAAQAAELLVTVTGQDLEEDACGVFRIARRVAPDRVISAVDPQARHGHKTSARGFDGYKGHIAADPDSEIITATAVTPGNSGDADAAGGLLADLLAAGQGGAAGEDQPAVYGDAAYGSGELLEKVEQAGLHVGIKVQPPPAPKGHFPKDRFVIDLDARDRHLPRGHHRGHPRPHRASRRRGQLRRGLPHMPAGSTVHHRALWPHHHHRPARDPAGRRPDPAGGSSLESRIPGNQAQGRAQDRPSYAQAPRRPACPGPRQRQGRR